MTWRDDLILFGLGLLILTASLVFQRTPGYMDAEYYYAGGARIASGKGFTENYLWNYLDDPQNLPHPAFTYWMPLASLVSFAGMSVLHQVSFQTARLPFLLLAGLVPIVTARLEYVLLRRRSQAIWAGVLALAPGYYLSYAGTTDTFYIYMLLGTAFIILAGSDSANVDDPPPAAHTALGVAALGIVAGLMHLTRADGLVWAAAGFAWIAYWRVIKGRNATQPGTLAQGSHSLLGMLKRTWVLTVYILGYLIVMGAWYLRNLNVFGALLPPGGGYGLWLTNYDQIVSYPASQLTFHSWLNSGWVQIVLARWDALKTNLTSALGVQAEIFLLPLVIVGFWTLRKEKPVYLAGAMWLVTLLTMSLVFPFAGARGGFFHSGAAFQPMVWALAVAGLDQSIRWGAAKRGWNPHQAWNVFAAGLFILGAAVTAFLYSNRVIGGKPGQPVWNASWDIYADVERCLEAKGASLEEVVMVNDPPGYSAVSGRNAVVIPNGGVDTSLAAANRFHARYLLLEENHVKGLDALFADPRSLPGLHYMGSCQQVHIFSFILPDNP